LSTTSSSIRTKIRGSPSVVVSKAVGPSLIVVSFAVDRDRAGHRRRRITRRAHACHQGKKSWTVIRHACCLGLANALTAGALVVAMIEPTLVTGPMTSTRRSLRRDTGGELARRPAEPLAAIAGAADAEHELAQSASLETKLVVVHRSPGARTENLLRTSASSIVCSKPASIG